MFSMTLLFGDLGLRFVHCVTVQFGEHLAHTDVFRQTAPSSTNVTRPLGFQGDDAVSLPGNCCLGNDAERRALRQTISCTWLSGEWVMRGATWWQSMSLVFELFTYSLSTHSSYQQHHLLWVLLCSLFIILLISYFLFRNELHWLPVDQRIIYKLCLLAYKCQHEQAPSYLSSLCAPLSAATTRRHLRAVTVAEISTVL